MKLLMVAIAYDWIAVAHNGYTTTEMCRNIYCLAYGDGYKSKTPETVPKDLLSHISKLGKLVSN